MKTPESFVPETSSSSLDLLPAGPLPDSWLSAAMLSEIIHRAGHDIGNPLTAIISLASILEFSSAPQGNSGVQANALAAASSAVAGISREKLQEYSLSINAEAWKISHLSERLVMLLSNRVGNLASHSVGEIAERVLQRLRSRQKIEDLRVESDFFFAPTAARVRADGDQLFLLISEVFINAYNFQPPADSATTGRSINCALSQEEDMVILRFRNTMSAPYEGDLLKLLEPMHCGVPKISR